jgi:hypothetical protein
MVFVESLFVLLSFCALRILEYLLGYFLEILCMEILFCLYAWLNLIFMPYDLLHCLYFSLASI